MFSDLNVFRVAHAMAAHAGQRQAVIAQNVANADTPGYRARDIPPFETLVRRAGGGLSATRPGHLGSAAGMALPRARPVAAPGDPNGNSVSLEQQMMRAVEAKRQHDRALAVYRSGLNILRATFSSR